MKFKHVLLLFSLGWISCNSIKSTSTSTDAKNELDPAYYLNIQGVAPRLAALMSGRFSCYRIDANNKEQLWPMNNGQDSLVLNACLLGEPAKDGYWIYYEVHMTHLPENPITQRVYNIEPLTIDSLSITTYNVVEKGKFLRIYNKSDRPLNKEYLADTYCSQSVHKKEQLRYDAFFYTCTKERLGKMYWVDGNCIYTPRGINQTTLSWKDKDQRDTTKYLANITSMVFKRLPSKGQSNIKED